MVLPAQGFLRFLAHASFLKYHPGYIEYYSPLQWSIYPKLGCRLKGHRKLWYFPRKDFLDFWQELRKHLPEIPSTAGFSMWTPIHSIITETCLFWHKKIFCWKSKSKTPTFFCRNRKNQLSYK